jgi:cell division GTPase FtsZ
MYEQTYKRLEKLKATFDNLVISNQKMAKKIREQEQYIESTHEREVARERVLKALSEKIKEDGEGIPPPS